ncbi:NAD(P)H-hydrate epimerase [Rhodobacter capsulatus R121]|jgi:NAD(P)H-hydrate epimerase|uniref:NAD(P)H-hydrate epimerase n=2 Tax=Rhodobacter capsulatus TaxID=1061 RepID=NNRE_RHOCB|nr:NAD(P)H-hydrate epimerase [Rhodobacter capsulatus]D5ATX8.1 RecName: Full=NAD(P)H-hydrate epimerase; AltName: Full=NAD(P)HX epimerase [Rhodobacter capsulatus SB 1003]ETD77169.1 NAD(P)H-hydrate epimerase [Rhodobacter capsulatus R121]ETD79178.1 NAD(P)H-hydrate epimerase [Rhodobacter capsulatus B6]ETD91772.1 NAD(P)H-hydrate epimerase [Rhodobacter capsulatus YW2]ETE53874.1 NAD(P)H-hydrate epimerase [Rhodobacter capsulatus Y262]ADE85417.1 YjeF-related protein family [Rhodobacter capsulatus SB 10
MTEILTSDDMRSLERAAIASGRASGLELMERAGAAVVEAIAEAWPDIRPPAVALRHAMILCGPGNNGGDGFVVARLLRRRGWKVTLYLYGEADRLPPDARANHDRWRRIGTIAPLPAAPDFSSADLVVDALFGLGLTRPLTGFGPIFAALASAGRPVLAIDLPSGRDADARADAAGWPSAPCSLAVTFHREKPAHAQLRAEGIGVIVKPIGL